MKKIIFFFFIFFGLTRAVMADSNMARLPDTAHTYTKNYNGSALSTSDGGNSIDGDSNTRFGHQNSGGDPPQIREITIVSEHAFGRPCTLKQVVYRMYADARANGKYIRTHNIEMYVQYFDTQWHDLPGSRYNAGGGEGEAGHDSGTVTYNGVLNNVTKIRAYCHSYSQASGGEAGSNSEAWVYELQAWGYVDIGLRAYDGTGIIKIACEPAGALTSPLKIHKNGTTYAVILVNPGDARASKIRIKTNSGIKALAKVE